MGIAEGRSASVVNDLRTIAQEADRQGLKYLELVSSVDLATALINSKNYAQARPVLDQALNTSEKLGRTAADGDGPLSAGESTEADGRRKWCGRTIPASDESAG